ncbi:hypothetical protein RZS08_48870, partial [Arthrospira platensis SPKY1]|nr:hypothetical protein [Arthrospira platensis SPKY1]
KKYDKAARLKGEFDVIAVGESAVYVIETKLTPDKHKLKAFMNKVGKNFTKLFPEYGHLPVVLIFASMSFDEDFIKAATNDGIFLMAYREWEYMDILNYEAVMKQRSA